MILGTVYSDVRLIKHSGSRLPDYFQVAVHAFSVGLNSTSKLGSLIFIATAALNSGNFAEEVDFTTLIDMDTKQVYDIQSKQYMEP